MGSAQMRKMRWEMVILKGVSHGIRCVLLTLPKHRRLWREAIRSEAYFSSGMCFLLTRHEDAITSAVYFPSFKKVLWRIVFLIYFRTVCHYFKIKYRNEREGGMREVERERERQRERDRERERWK